jgi:hypothetical protein
MHNDLFQVRKGMDVLDIHSDLTTLRQRQEGCRGAMGQIEPEICVMEEIRLSGLGSADRDLHGIDTEISGQDAPQKSVRLAECARIVMSPESCPARPFGIAQQRPWTPRLRLQIHAPEMDLMSF